MPLRTQHRPGLFLTPRYLGAITLASLIAGALLCSTLAGAQQVFAPRVDYETVPSPYAITVADVNLDGKMDLIAASYDSSGVGVSLGVGNGTFLPRLTSYGPSVIWDVAVGKFDSDAYPDILAPNDGSILICRGAGDGTFPVIDEYPASRNGIRYCAVGDFNGDGVDDVAVSYFSAPSGGISVFLSNGSGGFTGPFDYTTRVGPEKIIAVDVNADSKLDLVVANYGTSGHEASVSVFLGNGNGTFQPKADYGTALGPIGVTAADFNGDSKMDLAACTENGVVSVLLGNGTGSFASKTDYTGGYVLVWLAAADVNGDSKPDLVASDFTIGADPRALQVFLNQGDGTFVKQDATVLTIASGNQEGFINSLAVADFDGDGKDDIAVGQMLSPEFPYPNGYYVSVLLSCSPCAPTAVSVFLDRLEMSDGKVLASWLIPPGSSLLGTVQRRQDGGEWADLTAPAPIDGPTFTYGDTSVLPGLRYAYRLSLHDATDSWATAESWIYVPEAEAAPTRLTLRAPYPNPSRGFVSLHFGQPSDGSVLLRIFDVNGRLMAGISGGQQSAGWGTANWDGSLASGARAPSGVYFAVLEGTGGAVQRRFVLTR